VLVFKYSAYCISYQRLVVTANTFILCHVFQWTCFSNGRGRYWVCYIFLVVLSNLDETVIVLGL